MTPLVVRMIEDADWESCNEFHNRLYGTRRTKEQWRWEFSTQPLFAVVDDNGAMVGTQALIPITMIDRDGEIPSAKSEETLIDPSFRGMSLFDRMYDLLFKQANDAGIRVIWGFTPAVKPFEKVGFSVPAETSQLFFPVSWKGLAPLAGSGWGERGARGRALQVAFIAARALSLARLSARRARLASVELKTMDAPPTEADELSRRFVGQWGGITIHREASFLQWRLFRNPYVRPIVRAAYTNGRLAGWIAYATDDESMGYVVDLLVAPPEGRHAAADLTGLLLRDATLGLQRMGALGIRAWSVTRHPFDRLVVRTARRHGFYRVRRGEPMVLHLMGTRGSAISNIDNWYVTRLFTQGLAG